MRVADLRAEPLTDADARELSPYIRAHDLADLKYQETTAAECLLVGLDGGPAWGIWDGDTIIGAGGFTWEGYLWSMWRDLSRAQSYGIFHKAAGWARVLRMLGGSKRLWNVYLAGNRLTETFLRATHCVTIEHDVGIELNGRMFVPFHLKSFEELPRV